MGPGFPFGSFKLQTTKQGQLQTTHPPVSPEAWDGKKRTKLPGFMRPSWRLGSGLRTFLAHKRGFECPASSEFKGLFLLLDQVVRFVSLLLLFIFSGGLQKYKFLASPFQGL